jgi:thiamine transport system substrate-binding protein
MKKLALLIAVLVTLGGCQAPPNTPVRLAAHDSFEISEELMSQFEADTGYQLKILRLGDTGSLTNQLILTKNAPVADAFFGIDTTFLGRAEAEGVIQGTATAINYSDVCFNYDVAWFEQQGSAPPSSWRELINEDYRGLVVITNPSFSSPGLSFLATTHAGFDNSDDVDAYWQALKANNVKVAGSWEDAYFSDFTRHGGDRPIVLSYASSPSAEVLKDGTAGSKALLSECFRQTEFAGVISGSANEAGAAALVEFLLSEAFQSSVPEAMYVYPVVPGIEIPKTWARFATPAVSTIGGQLDIDAQRDQWLTRWSQIFDS